MNEVLKALGMTKEKAISELESVIASDDDIDFFTRDEKMAMELAISALKSGWIPVSERLPEDGRPVLIYAWNVHHVIARYDSFRTENGYKKCWVTADAWNGNTEIKHDVVAWMPLPEPYKAESEVKQDD